MKGVADLAANVHARNFNPQIRAPRHDEAQDKGETEYREKRCLAIEKMNTVEDYDEVPKIEAIRDLAEKMNWSPRQDVFAQRRVDADDHHATCSDRDEPVSNASQGIWQKARQ